MPWNKEFECMPAAKLKELQLEKLKETGYHFKRATGQLKDFKVTFRGLSMNDM